MRFLMILKTRTFALSFFLLSFILLAAAAPGAAASRHRARASSRRESRHTSRRESRRTARRNNDDERASRKSWRNMSRRERLAELRRRREEERRRREEIARREAARRAALARERAFNQALRDQTVQNIAKDETLAEDMEVRRVAINALGSHAGSVVVMNPQTGQIYTVVNQDWALRKGYKPCSTVKLITGLAGLGEKIISPVDSINVSASGGYQLDLTEALAYSNNGYFQRVGGQVGFDKIISYARELGLGERTGVNYPNEYAGALPSYKTGYAVNHMCSHGDDFEVTPIQLATLISAMANGGKLLVPHLPRTVQENFDFKTEVRRKLNIPQENFRRMLPGMIGAVNYGTARRAYDSSYTIAGKTGTCIGQGSWLGLFASYAPVGDPRLTVVVVTRGSHERSKYAAEIAGQIYRALAVRFKLRGAQTPTLPAEAVAPRQKLDAATAAAVSDEDKDEEGDAMARGEGGDEKMMDEPSGVDKKGAKRKGADDSTPTAKPSPRMQTPSFGTPPTGASSNQMKNENSDAQTTPNASAANANSGDGRPRRVTGKHP
jgi:penicillin-binding protein 2